MRHRAKTSSFNRDTKNRKAMIRSLVRGLFEHGEIETTQAKAKEVKRWADKLLPMAIENSLESKRKIHQFFGKRDIVNTLTNVIAPAISDRKSGFTTIEARGNRRGDNAQMSRVSLVKKPVNLGTFKKKDQQTKGK
ncbi:MAG TPA: 50S ribosomal protein L17 [Bacteroidetes bacterium]|nr:50S ribosomal protein L17 [Bacteroidota bacterium]